MITVGALIPIGGVALAWVALFKLNGLWFEGLAVSPYVGWVFLPAAVRVLSVLLFEWRGVVGLFLGAMITNEPLLAEDLTHALGLSTISATAPALALWLGGRWWYFDTTLSGIEGRQLLVLSALAAVCSSSLHSAWFYFVEHKNPWWHTVLPMTVGDFVGTLVVLYSAYFLMRGSRQPGR